MSLSNGGRAVGRGVGGGSVGEQCPVVGHRALGGSFPAPVFHDSIATSFADGAAKSLFFAEDVGERGRLRQVELGW